MKSITKRLLFLKLDIQNPHVIQRLFSIAGVPQYLLLLGYETEQIIEEMKEKKLVWKRKPTLPHQQKPIIDIACQVLTTYATKYKYFTDIKILSILNENEITHLCVNRTLEIDEYYLKLNERISNYEQLLPKCKMLLHDLKMDDNIAIFTNVKKYMCVLKDVISVEQRLNISCDFTEVYELQGLHSIVDDIQSLMEKNDGGNAEGKEESLISVKNDSRWIIQCIKLLIVESYSMHFVQYETVHSLNVGKMIVKEEIKVEMKEEEIEEKVDIFSIDIQSIENSDVNQLKSIFAQIQNKSKSLFKSNEIQWKNLKLFGNIIYCLFHKFSILRSIYNQRGFQSFGTRNEYFFGSNFIEYFLKRSLVIFSYEYEPNIEDFRNFYEHYSQCRQYYQSIEHALLKKNEGNTDMIFNSNINKITHGDLFSDFMIDFEVDEITDSSMQSMFMEMEEVLLPIISASSEVANDESDAPVVSEENDGNVEKDVGETVENVDENIEENAEKIEENTEKIDENTEKIDENTKSVDEKMEENDISLVVIELEEEKANDDELVSEIPEETNVEVKENDASVEPLVVKKTTISLKKKYKIRKRKKVKKLGTKKMVNYINVDVDCDWKYLIKNGKKNIFFTSDVKEDIDVHENNLRKISKTIVKNFEIFMIEGNEFQVIDTSGMVLYGNNDEIAKIFNHYFHKNYQAIRFLSLFEFYIS